MQNVRHLAAKRARPPECFPCDESKPESSNFPSQPSGCITHAALVDQEQFGKVTFVIRTRHGIGFRGLASCLIWGGKAFQNTALLRDVWLFRYVCLQNFSRHDRKAARQPKNFLWTLSAASHPGICNSLTRTPLPAFPQRSSTCSDYCHLQSLIPLLACALEISI